MLEAMINQLWNFVLRFQFNTLPKPSSLRHAGSFYLPAYQRAQRRSGINPTVEGVLKENIVVFVSGLAHRFKALHA